MIRRPPRSTQSRSSAASDVYKRQDLMTMTTASPRARHNGRVDESDPAARPRRRSFTAEYKAVIVDEYDQFPVGAPERGRRLRRGGLYGTHIAEWRTERDAAASEGPSLGRQ